MPPSTSSLLPPSTRLRPTAGAGAGAGAGSGRLPQGPAGLPARSTACDAHAHAMHIELERVKAVKGVKRIFFIPASVVHCQEKAVGAFMPKLVRFEKKTFLHNVEF